MLKFLANFLDDNERELRRLRRKLEAVNALQDTMRRLSDEELKSKTAEFKSRLERGEKLDDLLPEAFAVVREVADRVLGMRPFDVQVIGGMVLHEGKIAEMKTGEGKTLVATMPVYLNALTGEGVHVVTVNDYLAKRDSEWMGPIYKFLGLSVGLIVHGLDYKQRQEAYNADVTYGTNNEFGFDYLRDNMVLYKEQIVQRGLNYAIVDEVDSILIDEARTPLIISGQAMRPAELYYEFDRVVRQLRPGVDYIVDEKAHTVAPTEEGVAKVERLLGLENLYDHDNMDLSHYLIQALKAHSLMKRDRDYVVKDGKVIIVDEFTGRLMFGRRYSNGLHQAIEAKEGVKIEEESQTLATITFQNYFRMYRKLAGMTGTAATEADEFRKIYKLDVVVIPTHKPMIRVDQPDAIYKTEKAKFRAVVRHIKECHKRGQPVLVGTVSIEKSEKLSEMLKREGIPHEVLNAKHHEKEAYIVAQAGRFGAVTIATNMAGRGTDILLGGNPAFMARQRLLAEGHPPEAVAAAVEYGEVSGELLELRNKYKTYLKEASEITEAEHRRVVEVGGLQIIGTERHEARRIDNQLRGRSGRQGDPGASKFYMSLEDDLMRLFGADLIGSLMDRLGFEEDEPIEHPLITRAIETAQKRREAHNFEARKQLLDYDDVMNLQREVIYSQRRKVLEGQRMKENVLEMIQAVVERLAGAYLPSKPSEEWDPAAFVEAVEAFLPRGVLKPEELLELNKKQIVDKVVELAKKSYDEKEAKVGADNMRELERVVMLRVIDTRWMEHLAAMDELREGIGLRAYGQRDPLLEYKLEAYEMFQNMVEAIQEDVVKYLFKLEVKQGTERRQVARVHSEGAVGEASRKPIKATSKVGRNDPCPCGSGKKYKKCCGKTA